MTRVDALRRAIDVLQYSQLKHLLEAIPVGENAPFHFQNGHTDAEAADVLRNLLIQYERPTRSRKVPTNS